MSDRVMNMIVGSGIKLEKIDTREIYLVELLGYSVGRGLIISTPTESNSRPAIKPGDEISIRYLGEGDAYAFRSRVTHVVNDPYPHAHLEYPGGIQGETVRRAVRVPVQPNALRLTLNNDGKAVTVSMQNISLGGARLVSPARLGGCGERFSIDLPTMSGGEQSALTLTCIIRHVSELREDDQKVFCHGIEFENIDRHGREFIARFIDKNVPSSKSVA